MEKRYVRVCPVCHSTDVQPDLSADSYSKGFFNQWKCNSCGHTSLFFPEYTEEDAARMREKK